MTRSRREFLQIAGAGAMGAVFLSRSSALLHAFPLKLPPGLQLWTVQDELRKDRDATLRRIAAIGYREVELFELPPSPPEFRKKCDDLGLKIVSGHFYLDSLSSRKTIDAAKILGLQYMIVVFPTLRSLAGQDISNRSVDELNPLYEQISLDDYKWNAEQFNKYGEMLKADGLRLGYHNHAVDLKQFGNVTGFESLITATDPNLVVFEMDCGHVIHAGHDPIAFLRQFPARIRLLHLKDLKPGYSISTSLDTEEKDTNAEIGSGVIDWKRLFDVAKRGNVKHCFVEHEGEMDHPPLEAITISYKYLQQF
jgi:sugar phosphate isomerase/epimerase